MVTLITIYVQFGRWTAGPFKRFVEISIRFLGLCGHHEQEVHDSREY